MTGRSRETCGGIAGRLYSVGKRADARGSQMIDDICEIATMAVAQATICNGKKHMASDGIGVAVAHDTYTVMIGFGDKWKSTVHMTINEARALSELLLAAAEHLIDDETEEELQRQETPCSN